MTLLLIYLFVSVGLSFICSVLEAVLLSVTPSYMHSLQRNDEAKGKLVKKLKDNIDQSISSILIVNTFAHTMGAAGVGAQAVIVFGAEWQTAVAIGLTLIILYVSEIIPKTLGASHWKRLLIPSAYTISFLIRVTRPFVWTATVITSILRKKAANHTISREEILSMAELGEKDGVIFSKEISLIENLLELKNFRAKDILTPRTVVFALDANTTVEDAVEEEKLYLHSRIPVFHGHLDNAIGMVFSQSVLETSVDGFNDKKLEEISVPIFRVSENIPVLNLIDLFVKRKEHLFLVHDSYEQIVGVVSLEDAIETLLGVEIVDEMDTVEDMQELAKQKAKILKKKLQEKHLADEQNSEQ